MPANTESEKENSRIPTDFENLVDPELLKNLDKKWAEKSFENNENNIVSNFTLNRLISTQKLKLNASVC